MEKKLVIPKKGVKVRDEISGQHLPETGAARVITSYYDRRIKDGDLDVRDIAIEKKPASKNQGQKKDGDKQ